MIFDDAMSVIEKGRLGLNEGLPMGFDRLRKYIPDIQQKTYYLIGAESGVGKTSFADNAFLFTPYDWLTKNPDSGLELKVFYWSLEISKEIKIIKGVCRKLFMDYGLLVDVNYILSRGKNRISDEIYQKVVETRDYFCQMEDVLTIFDGGENPTGISKYMFNYAKDTGDIITKKVKSGDGTIEIFDKYIPHNPNRYNIIIIDHIALMKREQGFTVKANIDKMSEYLITLRNNFGFTPLVIQQLNREGSSADRIKLDRVEPQLSDFKDSSNTQQDSNVILTLFSPRRYEMANFKKYDIIKLKDRFRSLSVLKNRDGESDVRIGLQFVGEVGYFQELPPADGMDDAMYDDVKHLRNIIR